MNTTSPATASDGPRFLVLGAGGLGCPALLGLVAGGAERITVVDDDEVDTSNLQRQVLYATYDVGVPKAEAAARRLRAQNPELDIVPLRARLDASDLGRVLDDLPEGSVVLECTDSPRLKFATNDACLAREFAVVIGGVIGWEGQVMAIGREGTCYRCLYEAPPPRELAPACADVGVIGAVAGHLGWLMALHAERLMRGDTDAIGQITTFDGRTMAPRTLAPRARPQCPACAARGSKTSAGAGQTTARDNVSFGH